MVRVPLGGDGVRPVAGLALLALGACAMTVLTGVVVGLVYTSEEPGVAGTTLTLQHLRPAHESCAFGWVFLGGATVVNFYLVRAFGVSRAWRFRLGCQVALWAGAGAGIVGTLLAGDFTGREYLGYRPAFSAMILLGWLLFAWNYFGLVGFSLRGRPVYILMWSVAIPLFVITFLEGHLYLFEAVSRRPVRDLAIQWKSAGTLVGAFNLLAYGSIMYIAGLLKGDDSYAHSRLAFALFCVGVLNTFTNYGHHTYHLPQSPWIHWISFVVSMLEVLILAKVLLDLLASTRAPRGADAARVPALFVRSTTLWNFMMLVLALVISIPPLNALIHGTHVVVAHSMGAMIGIDSMILWAAFGYLVWNVAGSRHGAVSGARVRRAVPLVSLFLLVFWAAFLGRGISAGWARYAGPSAPDLSGFDKLFPKLMLHSGLGFTVVVLWILGCWFLALLPAVWPARRQPVEPRTPAPAEIPEPECQ